jgi:hypothetical protein
MIDGERLRMRPLILVGAMLLLAACTEATASRVDDKTFKIEGPGMGMTSDAPNQRIANRICPKGYRVLDSKTQAGGPDRATDSTDRSTIWTIRCL